MHYQIAQLNHYLQSTNNHIYTKPPRRQIGMTLLDLGLVTYEAAIQVQEQAVAELAAGGPQRIILLEHPPVITFGRNGGEENLPFSDRYCAQHGIHIVKSNRGGNITCHFPGQLVAYPIMRLDRRKGGLRAFFHDMEESVIRTLAVFDLQAGRREGKAGVWISGKKICSTGIAVRHWISSHGLSLNVGRDLSLFTAVTPCGLTGVQATSIHRELDRESPSMAEVKRTFLDAFSNVFGLRISATRQG